MLLSLACVSIRPAGWRQLKASTHARTLGAPNGDGGGGGARVGEDVAMGTCKGNCASSSGLEPYTCGGTCVNTCARSPIRFATIAACRDMCCHTRLWTLCVLSAGCGKRRRWWAPVWWVPRPRASARVCCSACMPISRQTITCTGASALSFPGDMLHHHSQACRACSSVVLAGTRS